MSTLQELLVTLEGISQSADRHAAELAQQAQRLSRAAAGAAAAARDSTRGGAREAAEALQSAQRAVTSAAQLLHQAATRGRAFVAYHSGAAGGHASDGSYGGQGGAGAFGDERSTNSSLASFWDGYQGQYEPPAEADWAAVPEALPLFSPPSSFASWVNDGGNDRPGRGVNCADCARAVELSWRGEPQVSAARADGLGGESFTQIEDWLGAPLAPATFDSIGTGLAANGHGASAYVVVTWRGGGGHAFNAVNHNGTVYFIDAQPTGGAVDTWPPKSTSPGYGFDESQVEDVYVNYRP